MCINKSIALFCFLWHLHNELQTFSSRDFIIQSCTAKICSHVSLTSSEKIISLWKTAPACFILGFLPLSVCFSC